MTDKKQENYRIAVIVGSLNNRSKTMMAAKIAVDELNKYDEIEVDLIDPKMYSLPFPGTTSESNDADKLQKIVGVATGVILATPEYHGSYSSVIKLIIENLGYPSSISRKPVTILGVASGKIGAIKSIEGLRSVCSHIGSIVLPGNVSIPEIDNVFDNDGNCVDSNIEKRIRSVATNLIEYIEESVCPKMTLESMTRNGNNLD